MPTLSKEKLLSIKQAARKIPGRNGTKGISASTVWRWVLHGCRGVRLESELLGGTRYTSEEAIERFYAAINQVPLSPSSADRKHEIECAEKLCDAAGI